MSPGKPLDPKNLMQDLRYIQQGTHVSEMLYSIFPPKPGARVLEPGCGSGKLGIGYDLQGCDVTMLDIDPGVIDYVKLLYTMAYKDRPTAKILVGSIFDLSKLYPESFDFVFNEGVPHQWPGDDSRRRESIEQMAAACKPGGTVCVIGSNAHCPRMMEYAEKTEHTYMDMPAKQQPFTAAELYGLLADAGMRRVRLAPVGGTWSTSLLLAGWGEKS